MNKHNNTEWDNKYNKRSDNGWRWIGGKRQESKKTGRIDLVGETEEKGCNNDWI